MFDVVEQNCSAEVRAFWCRTIPWCRASVSVLQTSTQGPSVCPFVCLSVTLWYCFCAMGHKTRL